MPWFNYNKRGVPTQDAPPDPYPVGTMAMFVSDSATPTTAVQTGWLLCNGTSYLSATYPLLAQIVTYGVITSPPGPLPVLPVNFTLPNFDTTIPFGVSGSRALAATDISSARTNHAHGGVSSNSHTHGFGTHTHVLDNHVHSYTHYHGADHSHGVGTYYTQIKSAAVSDPGMFNRGALGPNSISFGSNAAISPPAAPNVTPHEHSISGTVNTATRSDMILSTTTDTGSSGTTTSDGGGAFTTDPTATALTTPSQILPPYMNVYFIVKALDLSGTYT